MDLPVDVLALEPVLFIINIKIYKDDMQIMSQDISVTPKYNIEMKINQIIADIVNKIDADKYKIIYTIDNKSVILSGFRFIHDEIINNIYRKTDMTINKYDDTDKLPYTILHDFKDNDKIIDYYAKIFSNKIMDDIKIHRGNNNTVIYKIKRDKEPRYHRFISNKPNLKSESEMEYMTINNIKFIYDTSIKEYLCKYNHDSEKYLDTDKGNKCDNFIMKKYNILYSILNPLGYSRLRPEDKIWISYYNSRGSSSRYKYILLLIIIAVIIALVIIYNIL